jgi:protein translocase SEC61 complex gamma subunit
MSGKPSILERLREFGQNTKRIIRVARRPTFQEVRLIARVSGIGILIVGAVAYLLQILGFFTNEFFLPPATDTSTATTSISLQLTSLIVSGALLNGLVQLVTSPSLYVVLAGACLLALARKH